MTRSIPRTKILVCAGITQRLREQLARLCDLVEWTDPQIPLPAELLDDVEIVVLRTPFTLSRESVAAAHNMAVLIRAGSGTDPALVEQLRERGVAVYTLPLAGQSVAEHAFALLLAVMRELPRMHDSLVSGGWEKAIANGAELCGKTMLIVGFGDIGQRIARIAVGFGVHLLVSDRSPQAQAKAALLAALPDAHLVSSVEGFSRADIVVLSCSLNSTTQALVDATALASFKPGAILINVGRAQLVDEAALQDALSSGVLAGCGLDVHFDEPNVSTALFAHGNVVATPHIGAQTADARARIEARVVELVRDYTHTRWAINAR